ncbi:MAG: glycoside hydrolase family 2, partial [Oscillospiraceae bacterium]|nr:glycoside hydrolase family 2 [Oscillospiraceae bacterium]
GCRITVSDQEGPVFSSDSPEGSIEVPSDRRRLWSPEDPFLYDVKVTTPGGDEVSSYLALRRITSEIRNGVPRICLNGKPVFLNGVLDQGYFPEGLFLPGDASAYRSDILRMKEMGFNTLRKHIKIEPEMFYYECDRLGMLVIQDMVNSGDYSFLRDTVLPTVGIKRRNDSKKNGEREEFFLSHMRQTADHLHGHPCVVAYTVFNEGWGQFNSDEAYDILKAEEPDRLIDTTSGWFAGSRSDFDSEHIYFRTKKLRPGVRPMLLSECGGFVFDADPQTKKGPVWGYGRCRTSQELTARIVDMYRRMVLPAVGKGLCGCIFTQLSDVENELNGLVTYERTFVKADPDALKKISDEILMELNS